LGFSRGKVAKNKEAKVQFLIGKLEGEDYSAKSND